MSSVVDLGTIDHRLGGLQRPAGTLSGGLCRAVAARLGIDPLLIRVATVALALAAGIGIVVYAWGTLLTPREGGVAPIRRFVPAFERWTQKTQILVVAISSLVIVVGSATQGNMSLLPVMVVVGLILILRRRDPAAQVFNPDGAALPVWVPESAPPATAQTTTSIEEWRERLAFHAALRNGAPEPLPVVDLYGPEPGAKPAAPRVEPSRVSWLGGVAVAGVGVAAALGTIMIGLTPALLWAAVAGTGAAGVAMLLWSLVVRSRRLPSTILVLALAMGAVSSGAVLQSMAPAERVSALPASGQTASYEFVAEGNAVVDLSDVPLDVASVVNIDATMSNVRVLLAAEPMTFTQEADMSQVDVVHPALATSGDPRPRSSISLHIAATMSNVTVEYLS